MKAKSQAAIAQSRIFAGQPRDKTSSRNLDGLKTLPASTVYRNVVIEAYCDTKSLICAWGDWLQKVTAAWTFSQLVIYFHIYTFTMGHSLFEIWINRFLNLGKPSKSPKNFEFCICIHRYLCYRVVIPVEREAQRHPSAGSSLRHWPPGTDSSNVRAVFFCPRDDERRIRRRSGCRYIFPREIPCV